MALNTLLIDEYATIHAKSAWGGSSIKNLPYLIPHLEALQPRSVIDYGCGKSPLIDALPISSIETRARYDPAIPEYAERPDGAFDLLINIDVLEHIPEEDLDDVIAEMRNLANDAIIVVDTKPAELVLADGRNAHISLHPHEWWQARLSHHFGSLYPIRMRRSGRAAFRTWPLRPGEPFKLIWKYWSARLGFSKHNYGS
ncbi:MAG: methyltransferase domain-containing protein [Hyphomicrobiales bacterium]|jgi:hypothetical protein